MNLYPENTLSKFTNKLSSPLELNEDWEVAITEIFYPNKIEDQVINYQFVFTSCTENRDTASSGLVRFSFSNQIKVTDLIEKFNESIKAEIEDMKRDGFFEFVVDPYFRITANNNVVFECGKATVLEETLIY